MSAVRGHRASPSASRNMFQSSSAGPTGDMASLEPSSQTASSSRGGSQPTSPGLSPKRKGSRASAGSSGGNAGDADAIHVLESLDESAAANRTVAAANKRKTQKQAAQQKGAGGTGAIFNSAGADANIIRSGHEELNTLWASNDVKTGPITVNVCNAPNNSTVQCGCDNINCPFCNLMLSIEKTDPNVLQ